MHVHGLERETISRHDSPHTSLATLWLFFESRIGRRQARAREGGGSADWHGRVCWCSDCLDHHSCASTRRGPSQSGDVVRVVRREVSAGALIRSVTWNDCILVGVSPGCGYGPRTIRNGDDLGGLHVLDAVGAAIPISSLAATPVRVEPLPWQQETTIVVPAKWLETLLHRTSSRIVQPARSCFES